MSVLVRKQYQTVEMSVGLLKVLLVLAVENLSLGATAWSVVALEDVWEACLDHQSVLELVLTRLLDVALGWGSDE